MKTTFTFQILLAAVAIAVKSDESGFLRANCGGSATADSSSLIFPISPDGDHLLPGEACIWTIHLETTRGFRFTLTDYSDNSTSDDCSDAGVRIYSLTNLAPGDKLQSYTFCSAKPPADDFFLNENVAAVILYASGNSSSPVKFNQFNLAWEGSSFDPFQTKHVTSFSSASSGVIRYPALGQYEPSVAATWVVNSESDQNPLKTDFALERLGLQSCNNPDPCVCDALILYANSSSGVLEETQRFCSDSTDITISEVKSRFILGFFTDFQTQSDTGSGFQVVYYPSEPPTTTTTPSTTTEVVTSTTPESPNTQCGEIFTGRFGNITYKDTSNYDPNERCVWILRVPGAIRYDFSFITIDFAGQPADGIAISTFIRDFYPSHSYQQMYDVKVT